VFIQWLHQFTRDVIRIKMMPRDLPCNESMRTKTCCGNTFRLLAWKLLKSFTYWSITWSHLIRDCWKKTTKQEGIPGDSDSCVLMFQLHNASFVEQLWSQNRELWLTLLPQQSFLVSWCLSVILILLLKFSIYFLFCNPFGMDHQVSYFF